MMVLYQVIRSICFSYRWGSKSRSLIQQQNFLSIGLTETKIDLENLISLNDVGTFHAEDSGNNLVDIKINKNQGDDDNPWQKSKRKKLASQRL